MDESNQAMASAEKLELLAPAGDAGCFEAAVIAGADAVYLGLEALNARRRARNFTPQEFAQAVDFAHSRRRRVYLTLNTDVAEEELPTACQALELAARCGVDGVLVRDPAVLLLREHFPGLALHFSTQTCMTNSWDVQAAAELGAERVVLAREMTLAEIESASRAASVETEVFAQGALCFSVSGRCMMSSWGGGRSGNRGTCTSPCRVPWSVGGQPAGRPLSMHDWSILERIGELRAAGVRALKIEGRLKNARWVERAVSLYRKGIDAEAESDPETAQAELSRLRAEAESLGDYTGRQMTSDYLDARRNGLTGEAAGRAASSGAAPSRPVYAEDDQPGEGDEVVSDAAALRSNLRPARPAGYNFQIRTGGGAIECSWQWGDASAEWTRPKTVVRRKHKAMSVGELLDFLCEHSVHGVAPGEISCDDPDFLLVPRAANAIIDRVAAEVHRAKKAAAKAKDEPLPEWAEELLADMPPARANDRNLGKSPNRVRLHVDQLDEFTSRVDCSRFVLEGADPQWIEQQRRFCRKVKPVIALPSVFFEDDLPAIRALLEACSEHHLAVEVNSWGGLWAAREAGCRFEAGPGLAVLNSMAAGMLQRLGARVVTASLEANRRRLERLCAGCPAGLSIYVFARPVLAVSRVELSEHYLRREFADRRGIRMMTSRENGLWTFRAAEPFDWRDLQNENIRARYLTVDLIGSPAPVADWLGAASGGRSPERFNYERSLK